MFADVHHVKNAVNLLKTEFAAVARKRQTSVFVKSDIGLKRPGAKCPALGIINIILYK